jgi:hypothetical protein
VELLLFGWSRRRDFEQARAEKDRSEGLASGGGREFHYTILQSEPDAVARQDQILNLGGFCWI